MGNINLISSTFTRLRSCYGNVVTKQEISNLPVKFNISMVLRWHDDLHINWAASKPGFPLFRWLKSRLFKSDPEREVLELDNGKCGDIKNCLVSDSCKN